MGYRVTCAAVLAIGLTLASRVAAADLEGQSGPLAWRATDVQQNTTTLDGKRHARHEFGLTLKNTGPDIVRLSGYQAAMSYFGIHLSEGAWPLDITLTPGREFRLDLYTLQPCPNDTGACRLFEGPTWRIVVTGRTGGNEFSAPIEIILPVDGVSPVVRRKRVLVTRATSTPPPPAISAAFKANLVLVSASINGHDLALLLDTGAQMCVLTPEAAKRVGVSAPADGPAMPLIGIAGAPGNAALVPLPAVRVGDYVVEHLTGAITPLAGFPIATDGVLGANFISAFRVSIDHHAKELRLEPH